MKLLENIAKKWASTHVGQKGNLFSSLFIGFFGLLHLSLYFFVNASYAGVLGVGILGLGLSALLFERAGFVALIDEMQR